VRYAAGQDRLLDVRRAKQAFALAGKLLPPAEAALQAEVKRRLGDAFGAAYQNAGRFSSAWRGFQNRRLIEPENYEAAQVARQVAEHDANRCVRTIASPRGESTSVSIYENKVRLEIEIAILNRAPFQIGLVEEEFKISIGLENAKGYYNGCECDRPSRRTGVNWITPGEELRSIDVPPTPLRKPGRPEAGAAKITISGRIVLAGPWEKYEQTVPVSAFMWLPVTIND
jgi:hypothetical protein